MTDETEKLEVVIRSRGGAGKSAKWEWGIYRKGEAIPVKNGIVTGARKKAVVAGNAALATLPEVAPTRKPPKRPRDPNQLAKAIVDEATEETPRLAKSSPPPPQASSGAEQLNRPSKRRDRRSG